MESDGAGPSSSGGAGGSGAGHFEFGVDPSMDPELAMALRMSLEEEQARQRAAEGGTAAPSGAMEVIAEDAESAALGTTPALPSSGSLVLSGADNIAGTGVAAQNTAEEEMLRQAIALSRGGGDTTTTSGDVGDVDMNNPAELSGGQTLDEDEDMDEEEAIARAIEMSLRKDASGKK